MAPASATGTVRVLIVDDHPLLRDGVRTMLETDPAFEVVGEEADTAARALSEIGRLQPDILMLDLGLPDGHGSDICARVQAEYPRVRVLVLTLATNESSVMGAFRSGAHGYAVKTADRESLLAAVRAVAKDGTYIDPRIAHIVVKHAIKGQRARGPYNLTPQEIHVLELVVVKLSNPEIACQMGISVETVKTHLRHAMKKLGADDRHSAVQVMIRSGII